MKNVVIQQLHESAAVKIKIAEELSDKIVEAAGVILSAFRNGKKVLLAGNGGSAADAQHIAAEFVGRFKAERKALPALALTTNTSILTAIGNDYHYDHIFERQVQAFAASGDVFIAISTSGESPNIVRAAEYARKTGVTVVGLTGKGGGVLARISDIALVVPSQDTQRIQEAHITIGHIICGLVEQRLFSNG